MSEEIGEYVSVLLMILVGVCWVAYLPVYHFVFVRRSGSLFDSKSRYAGVVQGGFLLHVALWAAILAFYLNRPEYGWWRKNVTGYVGATIFISALYFTLAFNGLLVCRLGYAVKNRQGGGRYAQINWGAGIGLIALGGLYAIFAVRAEANQGPLNYDLFPLWFLILLALGSTWLLYRRTRDLLVICVPAIPATKSMNRAVVMTLTITLVWAPTFILIPNF